MRAPKPASSSYGSSPIRTRRTAADIDALERELLAIVAGIKPATVRQVFYQAVSRGLVPKTEAAYKGIVCRLLTRLRREGRLPYLSIADNTRWMRKPTSWGNVQEMLDRTAELYRRDLWANQDAYVEVWLEKDALAGVVWESTREWDVPLMVTRGYPSLSFVAGAAEVIGNQARPVFIYYLGDHDPSGVDIPRDLEAKLRNLAPDAEITFEVVAVTRDQIRDMGLPTRPTKRTDSRACNFLGESVEVDAIPPLDLRALVDACIVRHVDGPRLASLRQVEAAERQTLDDFVSQWSMFAAEDR